MRGWALAVLLPGCIVGETSIGGDPSGVRGGGDGDQIPTNGLRLDTELVAALTPAPLGVRRVDGAFDVNPEAAPGLVDSELGRELLSYVATCALGKDQELVIGDTRARGFYGLASEWTTSQCGETCQHWVIGCLLAHANHDGNHVHISLRGENAKLAVPPALAALFPRQEAAFFGAFGRDSFGLPRQYACLGTTATSDAFARALLGRVCGLGQCGVDLVGYCTSISAITAVCALNDGDAAGYADCRTSIARDAPTIHEVVTVYTEPPPDPATRP